MRRSSYIYALAAVLAYSVIAAASGRAATLWTSTFNCNDWTESSSTWYSINCDSLTGAGFDFCSDSTGSHPTQITSLANNSSGGGGKGLRTLNGDGKDNSSGSLRVSFASRQAELWVSWSMRYEAGFNWSPQLYYDKWLYFDVGDTCAVVPEWYGTDQVNVWTACGQNYSSASGNGWNSIMGGSASDGKYHAFKLHMKMDTNGSNGIIEMWVDGMKRISATNVNFGGGAGKTGWGWFNISSNQNSVGNNNTCMAVDFDDFVVSTTDTSDSLAPSNPPSVNVN